MNQNKSARSPVPVTTYPHHKPSNKANWRPRGAKKNPNLPTTFIGPLTKKAWKKLKYGKKPATKQPNNPSAHQNYKTKAKWNHKPNSPVVNQVPTNVNVPKVSAAATLSPLSTISPTGKGMKEAVNLAAQTTFKGN